MKFSNFMSMAGLLTPCSIPRGGFLYTMIIPGGGFLLPSSGVPGVCPWRGMVMDEIDTYIAGLKYVSLETKSILMK